MRYCCYYQCHVTSKLYRDARSQVILKINRYRKRPATLLCWFRSSLSVRVMVFTCIYTFYSGMWLKTNTYWWSGGSLLYPSHHPQDSTTTRRPAFWATPRLRTAIPSAAPASAWEVWPPRRRWAQTTRVLAVRVSWSASPFVACFFCWWAIKL